MKFALRGVIPRKRYETQNINHWGEHITQSSHRILIVNYSHVPRSGLPSPHLLRWELPVSVSERAETISTASTRTEFSCGPSEPLVLRTVPDSAGDFPLQVVRSVPLLPDGHSTTTSDARFLSRLNTGRIAVSVLLPYSTARVVRLWRTVKVTKDGGRIPSLLARVARSLRKGAYPPAFQLNKALSLLVSEYRTHRLFCVARISIV
ncbi:hypothetical protein SAMN05421858_3446 [Haladaptatus litoreus]|uniref:Uncharacterized protein n=1 Tax=Haladaptatus litoreus TaxID=553468 RepID=A0A1N7D9R1_9EURY|nr:hypothetical protein SAMN05421858_3446 [Haladaptatus litoreus]